MPLCCVISLRLTVKSPHLVSIFCLQSNFYLICTMNTRKVPRGWNKVEVGKDNRWPPVCLLIDEGAKVMMQLEQENGEMAKELQEIKSHLEQTEESLKVVEEQKSHFCSQLHKTADSLTSTMKELLGTLQKVTHVRIV